MGNFWKDKRVLVAGGSGFIGSHLVEKLLPKKAKITVVSKTNNLQNIAHIKNKLTIIKADLTDKSAAIKAAKNQEIIINLAAKVAGIQYNINHPVEMFSDNVEIAKNLLEAGVKNKVERFLAVSSACVYPRQSTVPTPESDGFLYDPEPTNLGYGWSKRVAELLARFYHLQYGLKIAIARPFNAYGPRDNFNPKFSHVIPGLIKRVFDGENPLVVWGSGKQTRSFIFVQDLAQGLLDALEKYCACDPINIGSDEEITIADLARKIIKISGKKTKIIFDKTRPDGQPRRVGDLKKAKQTIGFQAKTKLDQGLRETIEWYINVLNIKNQIAK